MQDQDDNYKSKKCSNCPFLKLFFSQLFEIGNSAGSLISEAINLFRTFQRLSATKTFTTKFSKEGTGMFKWATNLVKILISSFDTRPFNEVELFSTYTIFLPLLILTIMPALFNGYKQVRFFFFDAIFIALGAGFGYIGIDRISVLIFLPAGFFLLFVTLIAYFCCFKKKWAENAEVTNSVLEAQNTYQFTSALLASAAAFTGMLIPILQARFLFSIILSSIIAFVIILSFIIETSQKHCCPENRPYHYKKNTTKIVAFLVNCLSLLIIPSTESFIIVMKGHYAKKWSLILAYIVLTLFIPIATTFLMVKTNYSAICEKYRKTKCCKNQNCLCYMELVDIIKQIGYAIVATYDIPWGCIGFEVVWFILIIITRPYHNVSDYSLSFANSLVIFLANGGAIYVGLKDSGFFSFKKTVIFVIIACIPAIISTYLFFIFDFNGKIEEENENEKINEDNLRSILLISLFNSDIVKFEEIINVIIQLQ